MAKVHVIGGGFYGCNLAVYLANKGHKVTLYESSFILMAGASYYNQYKVHNGYHYPRDLKTINACKKNYEKFIHDFRDAIFYDFIQYYGIAEGSKVSGQDYKDIFSSSLLKDVTDMYPFKTNNLTHIFRVDELSFNPNTLRDIMLRRLSDARVEVKVNTKIENLDSLEGEVFVCTYSAVEELVPNKLDLFYKRSEILYLKPTQDFKRAALTVIDGGFFAFGPAVGRDCHVLGSVERGVHDKPTNKYAILEQAASYLPLINDCDLLNSHIQTKVFAKSTMNTDGRPIIFKKVAENVTVVLGAKIDNIYDMFEELEGTDSSRYILS